MGIQSQTRLLESVFKPGFQNQFWPVWLPCNWVGAWLQEANRTSLARIGVEPGSAQLHPPFSSPPRDAVLPAPPLPLPRRRRPDSSNHSPPEVPPAMRELRPAWGSGGLSFGFPSTPSFVLRRALRGGLCQRSRRGRLLGLLGLSDGCRCRRQRRPERRLLAGLVQPPDKRVGFHAGGDRHLVLRRVHRVRPSRESLAAGRSAGSRGTAKAAAAGRLHLHRHRWHRGCHCAPQP